jgi:hypothetical protein
MLGKLYSILFMQLCLTNNFLLYLYCHFLNYKKLVMTLTRSKEGTDESSLWDVSVILIWCYIPEAFSNTAVGSLNEPHKFVITFQPKFFVCMLFKLLYLMGTVIGLSQKSLGELYSFDVCNSSVLK